MNKSIISKAFVLLIAVGIFSCTDLEEKPLDLALGEELVEELKQTLNDDPETGASQIVGPVYAALRGFLAQDGLFGPQEHSTDVMQGPTRGTDWDDGGVWRVLHTHDWDANHRMIDAAWNDLNTGISRAYLALSQLEAAEVIDDPTFAFAVGEIRAMRAWYMWNVLDFFGQVPALDDAGVSTVLSGQDAIDFITGDLEAAIPDLRTKSSSDYGRITRGAAQTLLAKVYLNAFVARGEAAPTAADLTAVVSNTDAVMTGGQYAIAADYFDIFALDNDQNWSTSDEAMIVVNNVDVVDAGGPSHSRVMMTLHYNQKMGRSDFEPWNGFTTITEQLARFDDDGNPSNGVTNADGDVRFQTSDATLFAETGLNFGHLIGQQVGPGNDGAPDLTDRQGNNLIFTVDVPLNGANESQGIRIIKYEPDRDTPNTWLSDTDFILLRYSDAVLMNAEAKIRQSGAGAGDAEINSIRTARGASATAGADLAYLFNERAREFYWEGYRRTDMIREGSFTNDWTNKGGSTAATKTLFPIPQGALDVNPNLTQNPGY